MRFVFDGIILMFLVEDKINKEKDNT